MQGQIVVRYPPSPTGHMHIGNVRTFLFNYLFAKKNNGKIILRFEDTDKERSKPEFETEIKQGIQALGIPYDEQRENQSEMTDLYVSVIDLLLKSKHAYYCDCEERKPETCKCYGNQEIKDKNKCVIRFRANSIGLTNVKFNDIVLGEINTDISQIEDFAIAKRRDNPLYNLTVVVDDSRMEVSHVIRGQDHVSNTPKQLLIYTALEWDMPQFAHIPLITDTTGKKLSKRGNVPVILSEYLKTYKPEAIINFLALLGWSPGGNRDAEILSVQDLLELFTLERIRKSPSKFDQAKLNHINRLWSRNITNFSQ